MLSFKPTFSLSSFICIKRPWPLGVHNTRFTAWCNQDFPFIFTRAKIQTEHGNHFKATEKLTRALGCHRKGRPCPSTVYLFCKVGGHCPDGGHPLPPTLQLLGWPTPFQALCRTPPREAETGSWAGQKGRQLPVASLTHCCSPSTLSQGHQQSTRKEVLPGMWWWKTSGSLLDSARFLG